MIASASERKTSGECLRRCVSGPCFFINAPSLRSFERNLTDALCEAMASHNSKRPPFGGFCLFGLLLFSLGLSSRCRWCWCHRRSSWCSRSCVVHHSREEIRLTKERRKLDSVCEHS